MHNNNHNSNTITIVRKGVEMKPKLIWSYPYFLSNFKINLSQVSFKDGVPWFQPPLKYDHQVIWLYYVEDFFQKSVQKVLKLCFYVATPTSSQVYLVFTLAPPTWASPSFSSYKTTHLS